MSSVDDTASDTEALFLSIAMKVRKPELKATGQCLNCEVEVPEGRKFCDQDCREDWSLRNERRGK